MRRNKAVVVECGEWRPSLFMGRLRDKKMERLTEKAALSYLPAPWSLIEEKK